MPFTDGYISVTSLGGAVDIRIYCETTAPYTLINGPRGLCLDVTNTSGKSRKLTWAGGTATIGQGDPVNNISRTVTQVNNAGYFVIADVAGLSVTIT